MFDFLKKLPGMKLGDLTGGMMGPGAGEGGWQTTMQKEGSPFVTTPGGAFAGFNPSVGNIGEAMRAASSAMPGGASPSSLGQSSAQGAFSAPPQAPPQATPQAAPQGVAGAGVSRTPQIARDGQSNWITQLMRS